MRSLPVLVAGVFAAGAALAEEVGAPAGCAVAATLVKPDCEMHQVLACDGAGPVRVDVYKDSVFLGEQAYAALAMVRWRRGRMLQELTVTAGDLAPVPTMPEGALVDLTLDRSRRMLGTDAAPLVEAFTYRIEVIGPAIRGLPGGGDREVRRYRLVAEGAGGEASDLRIDFDQALQVPIWAEGTATGPDGNGSDVLSGTVAVLLPGDAGFAEGAAPDGAACAPG